MHTTPEIPSKKIYHT